MIPRRVANRIFFGLSVAITAMTVVLFLYVLFNSQPDSRYDTLVGAGVGILGGVLLLLYIWRNRKRIEY